MSRCSLKRVHKGSSAYTSVGAAVLKTAINRAGLLLSVRHT